jgi:hypothetical protein
MNGGQFDYLRVISPSAPHHSPLQHRPDDAGPRRERIIGGNLAHLPRAVGRIALAQCRRASHHALKV